jgi:hypothetical protein
VVQVDVSDVSEPEKNKKASSSHISRCVPAFQIAHEAQIDQNTKKKRTSKLKNSFGAQGFCFSHIVSNYFLKSSCIPNRNSGFGREFQKHCAVSVVFGCMTLKR